MLTTVLPAQGEISPWSSTYTEDVAFAHASPSIRLTQCEVMKIDSHLTDIIAHHLHPQTALTKVAGHETGESWRHDVRDVVRDCGVAVGQEYAAHPESHGTFTLRLTVLLAALVGI